MDERIIEGRVEYDEWVKTKKYVVVTTVSSFHHYYVVPLDLIEKQMFNNGDLEETLSDLVLDNRVEEFSQTHVGENILTTDIIDEEKMLALFDKTNDYLAGWKKQQKIDFVRNLLTNV
jgi:hypothetical protein